jgi:hypothetical protein
MQTSAFAAGFVAFTVNVVVGAAVVDVCPENSGVDVGLEGSSPLDEISGVAVALEFRVVGPMLDATVLDATVVVDEAKTTNVNVIQDSKFIMCRNERGMERLPKRLCMY